MTDVSLALDQCNADASGRAVTSEPWLEDAAHCSGAYLHVPFCFHKCHYCDFYSIVDGDDRQEMFVDTMERELSCVGAAMEMPIDSIFIGGGTPTLLAPALLARLMRAAREYLPLSDDAEWTVEANPETVTAEIAAVLAEGGATRVSIGAQSFQPQLLEALERWHDPRSVPRAMELVRAAGIDDINLDLIFAIPGQDLAMLDADLDSVLDLSPTHASCYSLVYEAGTPLRVRRDRGDVTPVDEDIEATMYLQVIERMAESGFEHYEISNFAAAGHRCRHNLLYWHNGNWWPVGPAAAGHVNGRRWRNVPRLGTYLLSDPLPTVVDVEAADADRAAGEAFMMGLRLLEGMERGRVQQLLAAPGGDRRAAAIEAHCQDDRLAWREGLLALTDSGLLAADLVVGDLLAQCTPGTDRADTTPG